MTTKLSRLLREAAVWLPRNSAYTMMDDKLPAMLLAEADRLDAGPVGVVIKHGSMESRMESAIRSGWLAACGGEEKG